MTRYDLAVCGAGPAGAVTAYYAAKAGLEVLLLDKQGFPRDKACGGLLTPRALTNLPGLEKPLADMIECTSSSVNLFSPSGNHRVDFDFGAAAPHNIRRRDFDHAMVKAAQSAGAQLHEKTRVTGLKVSSTRDDLGEGRAGPRVELTAKGPEGDIRYEAKLAVGAEGALGPTSDYLRDKENLPKWTDKQMGTAVMSEAEVGEDFIKEAYGDTYKLLVHFKPDDMDGYAWVFPKATTLNIGFGGYNRDLKKRSIKQTFANYVELLRRQGYYPKALPVCQHKGAPLPLAGPLRRTYTDGLMLVGDAASMVSPLSGEGLFYGMRAGMIAAGTAVKALEANDTSASALAPYEAGWKAEFHREFKDLAFFARAAIIWPERLVYYGTRDDKLKEMFADLFLGLTPGGLRKTQVIPRVIMNAIRHPLVPKKRTWR